MTGMTGMTGISFYSNFGNRADLFPRTSVTDRKLSSTIGFNQNFLPILLGSLWVSLFWY